MAEKQDLLETVKQAYSQIAEAPGEFDVFPTGRKLAENLGYSPQLLDSLPKFSVEAFCGVANLWNWATVTPQADVLDLGCGAGLDTILAAKMARTVYAIDFSPSMLERNRRAVAEAGLTPKVIHGQADAQRLPIEDQTLDVTLINGIFNLNADPQRQQIFSEVARVSRPGGIILAAEIILKAPHKMPPDPSNWFA